VCGFVHDLSHRLVATHGHQVTVLAPTDTAAGDDARFRPVAVERFRHPWPFDRRLVAGQDLGSSVATSRAARLEAASFSATFRLAARRAARNADAVLSHWLVPSGAVGASLGRPNVAIAHGGDVHLLARLPGGASIARSIARRSRRIVCVSRDLAERFAALVPDAAPEVIPMGAELGPEPDPWAVRELRERLGVGNRPVMLFLGRLVPIKGVDVLLEAARRAPELALWIAGDGPESARLRDFAAAARLRVSFLGRVDRRHRRLLLAACDTVVLPSRIEADGRHEGAPVVGAEAVAAGRPLIGTRSGGIVELIDDGDNGFVIEPEDAHALGAALSRFAFDAALRSRLAAGAAARSGTRTMRETAARFAELLETVVR